MDTELREIVVARVEQQMMGEQSAAVAKLVATGLTWEGIRNALVAKALGDPNWKAGLR